MCESQKMGFFPGGYTVSHNLVIDYMLGEMLPYLLHRNSVHSPYYSLRLFDLDVICSDEWDKYGFQCQH